MAKFVLTMAWNMVSTSNLEIKNSWIKFSESYPMKSVTDVFKVHIKWMGGYMGLKGQLLGGIRRKSERILVHVNMHLSAVLTNMPCILLPVAYSIVVHFHSENNHKDHPPSVKTATSELLIQLLRLLFTQDPSCLPPLSDTLEKAPQCGPYDIMAMVGLSAAHLTFAVCQNYRHKSGFMGRENINAGEFASWGKTTQNRWPTQRQQSEKPVKGLKPR